ncbi:hypothetical protein ABW20_dc0107567 [Dactylellina cionopaga]|nr:hypothetical protein ABW20_dc0107567 [Dactylellina cionopaga]
MTTKLNREDYSIGWLCAIPIELEAARKVLDEVHPKLSVPEGDENCYEFGRIGEHNVVISWLPQASYGLTNAAIVATRMSTTFTRLRFGLMVGVGGGAPSSANDIRLGDIVISQPTNRSGGVIQYDFGKSAESGVFQITGSLNAPSPTLLSAVSAITAVDQVELGQKISDAAYEIEENDARFCYPGKDTDKLFRASYLHVPGKGRQVETCSACDTSNTISRSERPHDHPYLHYGIIASANQVMKDGVKRDKISTKTGALCFEMEAAGLMGNYKYLVVRGICDYSDGHKNKRWQPYAALVAAIYAKELLLQIPAVSKDEIEDGSRKREKIKEINFAIPFQELRKVYKYFSDPNSTENSIHEHDSAGAPRIYAITGTGGMGKTQTALEYAYRHNRDFTAVFWVSAASEDTIRTSFIDIMQCIVKEQARITWPECPPDYEAIASKLGIPGLIDSKGTVSADLEVVDNICSALSRWLQMSGNTKWLLIFDNVDDLETFDIQKYLPNQGGGAILITSRRPEFSYYAEQASLDGLDSESAVALLMKLAHLKDTGVLKSEATTLVEKLGFMPLAINHAGCYIHETKLPLEEYLSYYERAFVTVQSRKPKSGWSYRNDTTATTWEISFSRIKEQDEEAALLLLVCSYLNPEEVFEDMWEDVLCDRYEIKNKVLLLASYSLVRITRFGVFSVHPVIHSWARVRSGQSEPFKAMEYAVIILGKASQQGKVLRNSNEWEAREERRVGFHLDYIHRYLNPLLFESILQEKQESKIQSTFGYVQNIALVFENQGRYDEAMQWYERALTGYEAALGKDHPSTLATVNAIAIILDNQGKYEEAMQWYERALTGCETALGKDHQSTLDTVHNIALVFYNQGKYDEAMRCTVNNIALVFYNQGKYEESMRWYERALAGKETALGKDHPSTLATVHGIAIVSKNQALATMNNMAGVFKSQGKYEEAKRWYERALIGYETVMGKDHPLTLSTAKNLRGLMNKMNLPE